MPVTDSQANAADNIVCATSYNVASTEIVSGLPPMEQVILLARYRTSFHHHAAERACQISDSTYDICCEYFKALDALKPGSDTDSLFDSEDEGPPPLEPISPSAPASLDAGELQLFNLRRNGHKLLVPANIAAALTDPTEPPSSGNANDGFDEDEDQDDTSDISSSASVDGGAAVVFPAHAFHVDGEVIERVWTEPYLPPHGSAMGEGYRHSLPENSGPVHELQILSLFGNREVKCNCADGKHAVYERHQEFAYVNRNGDVVIKKSQTLLLPLN
ncbi:hypothetical protein B0H16DRAFT_1717165 [Mycena metata]|uniref:Uncharacterized protein n=1 Tax=Mycena metata TaxID=1033252 RepID=A0AAD7JN45_9AGAR|nr:hypothetical protein B0H16DRAFT_1717165 [Mycena metata]